MKLLSIQYLRAIAATGVVLTHASETLLGDGHAIIPFGLGASGVDLFFVISGFVMAYTTKDDMSPGGFMMRRLIRVVPIYFLLTSVAFLLSRLVPGAMHNYSPYILDYLRSIAFIPYASISYHAPIIGQGWTLNYEMFFYCVFALCMFVSRNANIFVCVASIGLLVVLGASPAAPAMPFVTFTNPIMLEFALGIIVGWTVLEKKRVGTALGILSLIAALIGINFLVGNAQGNHSWERVVWAGVPAVVIVSIMLFWERRGYVPKIPALLAVGDGSYSLYLTHTFTLSVLGRVWTHLFDVSSVATHAAFMCLATIVAVLGGQLFYMTVEKPITKYGAARLRKWEAENYTIAMRRPG